MYYFQQKLGRNFIVQNYCRLKYENNTFEIDLNKPIYYFAPSSSFQSEEENYNKLFFYEYYDHLTSSYSLSYNTFDTSNFNKQLKVGDFVFVKNICSKKKAQITNINKKVNLSIDNYDHNNKVLTVYPNYLEGIGPGTVLRCFENLSASEFFFTVSNVDIVNSTLTGANDPLGFDLSVGEGTVEINTVTLNQDLWLQSFTVPVSTRATRDSSITSRLVTTLTEGLTVTPTTPFKNNQWDVSEGNMSLTEKAKRNKIYIKSYDHTTNTYLLTTLSGNNPINYTFLYNNLKTRVYRYNKYKETTITNVNTAANTFTTLNDLWSASYVISPTGIPFNYVLDEMLTITDDTAGTWKIFPKLKQNVTYFDNLTAIYNFLSGKNVLPFTDTGSLSNYSVPFILYYDVTKFVYRYVLSADPGTPKGRCGGTRYIYSNKPAFNEIKPKIYYLSCYPITIKEINLNYPAIDSFLFSKPNSFKIITNYNFSNLYTIPFRVKYVECDNDFNQTLSNIIEPFDESNATVDIINLPLSSTFGKKITVSDNHILIVDSYTKVLYSYGNSSSLTPVQVNGYSDYNILLSAFNFNSIINFGDNLTCVADSLDTVFAGTFSYDLTSNPGIFHDGIFFGKIFTNKRVKQISYFLSTEFEHSSSSNNTNKVSNIFLTRAQDAKTKKYSKILLFASRPDNTYFSSNSGIVEVYEPIYSKSLSYIFKNSLSGYKFGSQIQVNENLFVTTLSSSTNNLVKFYELSCYNTGVYSTTGTNTFTLHFTSYETQSLSGNNNFGKYIHAFNQLYLDPYVAYKNFNNEILTTDRVYIVSDNNLHIYEKFINSYLPLTSLNVNLEKLNCCFNNFVSISSNKNYNYVYSLSY